MRNLYYLKFILGETMIPTFDLLICLFDSYFSGDCMHKINLIKFKKHFLTIEIRNK